MMRHGVLAAAVLLAGSVASAQQHFVTVLTPAGRSVWSITTHGHETTLWQVGGPITDLGRLPSASGSCSPCWVEIMDPEYGRVVLYKPIVFRPLTNTTLNTFPVAYLSGVLPPVDEDGYLPDGFSRASDPSWVSWRLPPYPIELYLRIWPDAATGYEVQYLRAGWPPEGPPKPAPKPPKPCFMWEGTRFPMTSIACVNPQP